jgi:ankyrin repeat protein
LRKRVEDALLARAQGTFLWVGFVVAELSKKSTWTDIIKTLDGLPSGLPAIYGRMLLRTPLSRRPVVVKILRWVTMAVIPLTLEELAAAVQVQSAAADAGLSSDQAILDHLTWCGPILKIHQREVSLIHQSAKDYLLRETPDPDPVLEAFRIKGEEAHAELTEACLECLERSELQHSAVDLAGDPTVQQRSPLLKYAALHWAGHAKHASTHANDVLRLSRPFLRKRSRVRLNWWMYRERKTNRWGFWGDPVPLSMWNDFPVLHMASYFGICLLVRRLLPRKVPFFASGVNAKKGIGRTAMTLAVSGGHEDVVRLLLKRGADVDTMDLEQSAAKGYEAVVRLLLSRGVTDIGEALAYAVARGHETTVQLLLDFATKKKLAIVDRVLLIRAVLGGNEAVVKLLLDSGINTGGKEEMDAAAVLAAQSGQEAVVRLLLNYAPKADLATRDSKLVELAVLTGGETAVRVLLDCGINMGTEEMNAAVVLAARRGQEAVVQLLLDRGADMNSRSSCGETALMEAVRAGNEVLVRLLLTHGVNVNLTNGDGETALGIARAEGHEAVMRLLLSSGAE